LASARPSEPSKTITEQAKFLEALSGYAGALSEATDPASIAKLKAAASEFSSSAATLVAATPGGVAIPAAGSAIRLVVNSVVNFSEIQRQQAIRQIAAAVNDDLSDGLQLVLNDAENIRQFHLTRMRGWEEAARCNLRIVQKSSSAMATFNAFEAEKRLYVARIIALDSGVTAMGNVLIAHDKIATGTGDLRAAVAELNIFLENVLELKKAIAQQ
jgi:hypothetical protein